MKGITPFLWFNGNAEEAASFYVSLFPNSKIKKIVRTNDAIAEVANMPAGSVLTVEFELDGLDFVALNGGPHYQFSSATSFVVNCETQQEVDRYWDALLEGGQAQACGWLVDRFGVTWQVTPVQLHRMLSEGTPEQIQRASRAMMDMVKLDLPTLERAYVG